MKMVVIPRFERINYVMQETYSVLHSSTPSWSFLKDDHCFMVFPKGPPVDISGLQDLIFFPRGSSLLQLQNSVTSMEVTLTLKSAQPNAVFFTAKR